MVMGKTILEIKKYYRYEMLAWAQRDSTGFLCRSKAGNGEWSAWNFPCQFYYWAKSKGYELPYVYQRAKFTEDGIDINTIEEFIIEE